MQSWFDFFDFELQTPVFPDLPQTKVPFAPLTLDTKESMSGESNYIFRMCSLINKLLVAIKKLHQCSIKNYLLK